jgi:hypothetical protein
MDEDRPTRRPSAEPLWPIDIGRRLKTLGGGVRLQVRLPFCRCTPPVPHAVDDGVCGACGNAIRRGVGVGGEEMPHGL